MRDLIFTSSGAWPRTLNRPRVGRKRPRIILIVVLFPLPFGPSKPKISCWRISKSIPSTATARARIQKSEKTFVRPTAETAISGTSLLVFAITCSPVQIPARPFRQAVDPLCPILFALHQVTMRGATLRSPRRPVYVAPHRRCGEFA